MLPTVHTEAGWGCRRRNKKTEAPCSSKGASKEGWLDPFHTVPRKFYLPPLCATYVGLGQESVRFILQRARQQIFSSLWATWSQ